MYCRNTCELIKVSRLKRKLSQKELATKLNYSSPQFISNWERNKSYPPDETLKQIRKILKIRIKDVVSARLEDRRAELMEVL